MLGSSITSLPPGFPGVVAVALSVVLVCTQGPPLLAGKLAVDHSLELCGCCARTAPTAASVKPAFHTCVHHVWLVAELAWFLEGKTVVLPPWEALIHHVMAEAGSAYKVSEMPREGGGRRYRSSWGH